MWPKWNLIYLAWKDVRFPLIGTTYRSAQRKTENPPPPLRYRHEGSRVGKYVTLSRLVFSTGKTTRKETTTPGVRQANSRDRAGRPFCCSRSNLDIKMSSISRNCPAINPAINVKMRLEQMPFSHASNGHWMASTLNYLIQQAAEESYQSWW